METVIRKMKEIQSDHVGIAIYSTKSNRIVASYNSKLNIPLASADEAFTVALKCIYKEYNKSILGVSD